MKFAKLKIIPQKNAMSNALIMGSINYELFILQLLTNCQYSAASVQEQSSSRATAIAQYPQAPRFASYACFASLQASCC